jgi:DNA (cytosine-5)-methyltransferase 1
VATAHLAPFVTEHANASGQRNMPADEPMRTQCADVKGGHFALVAPYMVPRYGEREGQEPRAMSVEAPMPVVVPTGNGASLVAAHLTSYHAEKGGRDVRGSALDEPVSTLDTANRVGLVAAFLGQNNAGFYDGDGRSLEDPAGTACASGSKPSVVAASLVKLRGTSSDADPAEPLDTISAGGLHHGVVAAHVTTNRFNNGGAAAADRVPTLTTGSQQAVVAAHLSAMQGGDPDGGEGDPARPARTVTGHGKATIVYAFLQKYFGTDQDPRLDEPLHTATTKDRFGIVTVMVAGIMMVIVDIAMRMFRPRELYRAQGFPDSYVIDRGLWPDGSIRELTQEEQVRMCGNSVPPAFAAAIARCNVPEMIVRDEALPAAAPKPRARRSRRPASAAPTLALAGAA